MTCSTPHTEMSGSGLTRWVRGQDRLWTKEMRNGVLKIGAWCPECNHWNIGPVPHSFAPAGDPGYLPSKNDVTDQED